MAQTASSGQWVDGTENAEIDPPSRDVLLDKKNKKVQTRMA